MAYTKRVDGRKIDELRSMDAKVGVIPNADGSAYFKIGNTVAYCAVYGPRELFPKHLQDPKKGIIRCHYSMMPFSGSGERIRPGQNRRAQEISMVMTASLQQVVDLSAFPNAVVDIPIAVIHNTGEFTLLQMDGEISKDHLMKALEMGKVAAEKIYQVQRQALLERFTKE